MRCTFCRAFTVECDGKSHTCPNGHTFPVHPSSKEINSNGNQEADGQEDQRCSSSTLVISAEGSLVRGPDFDELVRSIDRHPTSGLGSRRVASAVPGAPRSVEERPPVEPFPRSAIVLTIIGVALAAVAWFVLP